MSRLDHLAETVKLARALGVDADALAFLADVDHDALRAVRERLTDTLFDDTRPMLQRAARASRLLPVGLVAKVGERVFGPLLCARMAGLMEPPRAIEVAQRMPDAFLADVSALLDPHRARAVIAGMPPARVVAVARVLAARGDHVTLARFVGYLPDATIRAVVEAIEDDEALLRTAFFLESKSTLDRLVALVHPERLRRVVALVARAGDALWAEALSLMTHVGDRWRRTLGDLTAEQDDHALHALLDATLRHDLWPGVIPVLAAMSEPSQRRLMALPGVRAAHTVRAIVRAADATGAWGRLLPLVTHMEDDLRRLVAAELEDLDAGLLDRVLPALMEAPTRLLPALAALALHLTGELRDDLSALLRSHGAPAPTV